MTTASRQSDFITEVRQSVRQLWEAYLFLKEKQAEWNAQDYNGNLANGVGANEGITAAAVGACVFATPDALTTLFNTGHATNLTNLL